LDKAQALAERDKIDPTESIDSALSYEWWDGYLRALEEKN
jgi:hypothetical protein